MIIICNTRYTHDGELEDFVVSLFVSVRRIFHIHYNAYINKHKYTYIIYESINPDIIHME